MNRTLITTSAVVLVTTMGLASCKSFSKQQTVSLRQVDDLVGKVERVRLESELSRQSARQALEALESLTSPDFGGDPVVAYAAFVESIERSEQQAEAMADGVDSMKEASTEVFEQWLEDLEAFTNPKMRRRSEARLEETRARYQAVLAAVEPCSFAHGSFNLEMRDYAYYLSHDFNSASVAEIEKDKAELSKLLGELEATFEGCEAAVSKYVRSAGLPGQIQ